MQKDETVGTKLHLKNKVVNKPVTIYVHIYAL